MDELLEIAAEADESRALPEERGEARLHGTRIIPAWLHHRFEFLNHWLHRASGRFSAWPIVCGSLVSRWDPVA